MDGSTIGNQSLLLALSKKVGRDVTMAEYEAIRAVLIDRGVIKLGRGRGGSVRKAIPDSPLLVGNSSQPTIVLTPSPNPTPTGPNHPSSSDIPMVSTEALEKILGDLAAPIVLRPVRRMTQGELENYLDKAADILRGNADHSEFRGYVFALLFYKRINDCFEEEVRTQAINLKAAGIDEAEALRLSRDPSTHHFVVPEAAAWETVARTTKAQLGQALNDAMLAIERANAHRENNFDGILTGKIDFNKQDELPKDKLVNLINHFGSQTFDRAHVSDDLFGNAYEYLIRNFASKAGKSSGEFYTPAEVGFLMAEMLEPQPGMSICDWASGSGGLLLQCLRYVKKHGGDVRQLFLHAQESNVSTYNISRINMILHGVPVWDHKQGDSLRDPRHLTGENRLKTFDRIIMNPPFSLEDWGYDTVSTGDKFGRFSFGMPPTSNGDWAWLQQIAKSLKDPDPDTGEAGQGMVVMSQGVLFRGQPEQTEEEDGQNQRADAEYLIRRRFIEADLIEAIVVLPGKLFYGNNVPGCLVFMNKAKPAERKDQILLIWASRHFQKGNPQNLLRPSDLMRILVPWRAFGDLASAKSLVPEHEAQLIHEVEEHRNSRLADIQDAFGPVLEPLPQLLTELVTLDALDLRQQAVKDAIAPEHPYFHPLTPLLVEVDRIESEITGAGRAERSALMGQRAEAKRAFDSSRKMLVDAIRVRHRQVARAVKDLGKLQEERNSHEQVVKQAAEREITHLSEATADLLRICGSSDEARRYFTVINRDEIEENEFNLNLPRYVDTFEPEKVVPLAEATAQLIAASEAADAAQSSLKHLLESIVGDARC
jgi:type I restriction enzyme M protein